MHVHLFVCVCVCRERVKQRKGHTHTLTHLWTHTYIDIYMLVHIRFSWTATHLQPIMWYIFNSIQFNSIISLGDIYKWGLETEIKDHFLRPASEISFIKTCLLGKIINIYDEELTGFHLTQALNFSEDAFTTHRVFIKLWLNWAMI